MSRRLITAAIAALTLGLAAAPALAQQAQGPIMYLDNDAGMNAAISEARRTLPVFWDRAVDADTSRQLLKVGLEADDGSTEFIWMSQVERTGDGFRGVLNNQPRMIAGAARGAVVTFKDDQIIDWAYEARGRLWGAYTQRVMLDDLPADAAAQQRLYLSDTPLEPTAD